MSSGSASQLSAQSMTNWILRQLATLAWLHQKHHLAMSRADVGANAHQAMLGCDIIEECTEAVACQERICWLSGSTSRLHARPGRERVKDLIGYFCVSLFYDL